jgi:molybdopterin-guanine dinucleotide biosynthesis protein A
MTKIDEIPAPAIPGVLLAGGLARRMGGGDKPMRQIGGRPILARVIARLMPQCDGLILNANGDPARFASFGLPVTSRYRLATVTWPAEPFDPFFNANTPDDIAAAERLAELDGE